MSTQKTDLPTGSYFTPKAESKGPVEQRTFHRPDGSFERKETKAELEERRSARAQEEHWEQLALAHRTKRAFENFREVFA